SSPVGWTASDAPHADPRTHHELRVVDDERTFHDSQQPLGHRGDLRRVVESVAHDDELVAAEPSHGVAVAPRAPQPIPELHEDPVAGVVADTVVEDLEPVEVEE